MNEVTRELFKKLRIDIEKFFTTDEYSRIYDISREDANSEIETLTDMRNKARGNYRAREYVINTYSKIASSQIFERRDKENNPIVDVNNFIDYENVLSNSPDIIFEILLDVYDVSEIIDKYALKDEISSNDINNIAKNELNVINKHFSNVNKRIFLIAKIIYSQSYGQDCIDTLQYHKVNDIGFTRSDYIYITYKTNKIHLEFLSFPNIEIAYNIQRKNTDKSKISYNQENVSIVTSKENSARIAVSGFDSIPDQEAFYNERIFSLKKISLEEQRVKYNTINELMEEFITISAEGRFNYLVTGADMTIGKSTMLLSILEKYPNRWAIGILDPQNEMQAEKKFKKKNIMTFIKNIKENIQEQFQHMLKFSRDIILISEVTGYEEASSMIDVSLSLNAGIGATMHIYSPYQVVPKLRNFLLRSNTYKDKDTAEQDISKALDLILHMSKPKNGKGRIVMESIYEIIDLERDQSIKPNFNGTFREKLTNLIDMFQLLIHKTLVNQNYIMKPIFEYDKETDKWIVKNLPSKQYLEKLALHADEDKLNKLIEKFKQAIDQQG